MKKSANKIDKIVTGVIIGTAVASMIGLSQTKKGKEITKEVTEKSKEVTKDLKKKSSSYFSKTKIFFSSMGKFYGNIFSKFLKKKDKKTGEK